MKLLIYISGTIAPLPGNANGNKELPTWIKAWLEPEVLVPILATIVVFIVGVVVICLTLARRNTPHRLRGQKDVYCMYGACHRFLIILIRCSYSNITFINKNYPCVCSVAIIPCPKL